MLEKVILVTYFLLVLNNRLSDGLESQNKHQRYNHNTDFLQHEAGAVPISQPKRDYVAPAPSSNNSPVNTKIKDQYQEPFGQDFDAQFPSLGGKNTASTQRPTGKMDYIAPNRGTTTANSPSRGSSTGNQNYDTRFPPLGGGTTKPVTPTTSTGKRDYVAPNRGTPSNGPSQAGSPANQNNNAHFSNLGDGTMKPTIRTTPTGKRDYVAPSRGTTANIPTRASSHGNQNYDAQFQPLGGGTTKPAISIGNNKVKDLVNFYENKDNTGNSPGYSDVLQNNSNKNQHVLPNTNTKKPSTPQRPWTSRPSTPVLTSSVVATQESSTGQVSDNEIKILSEELLRKDVNNAAKYVTINYQSKTTSSSTEDKAPEALLSVAAEAWHIPTITKFIPLLDNYERDTLVNEYVTPQERNEENAFMDAIMSTTVIRHLMIFLKEKGYVTPDPRQQRDFLKQLWFNLYSRGKGKISSSGFEHIFVSELKNGEVSGLHNWIYFSKEESANRVNYLGYLKYLEFENKGAVIKLHFNQQGIDKPVDTMFIGTSPELEIALYTLCFVTRADTDCNLKLGNKDVNIVTHTFRYRSKNLIGSAYPQF